MTEASIAVIMEQISRLRQDVLELTSLFKTHDKDEREWRGKMVEEHHKIDDKATRAHLRIDEQDKEIAELRTQVTELAKAIGPLVLQSKILAVLGSFLMLTILGYILGSFWTQIISP